MDKKQFIIDGDLKAWVYNTLNGSSFPKTPFGAVQAQMVRLANLQEYINPKEDKKEGDKKDGDIPNGK